MLLHSHHHWIVNFAPYRDELILLFLGISCSQRLLLYYFMLSFFTLHYFRQSSCRCSQRQGSNPSLPIWLLWHHINTSIDGNRINFSAECIADIVLSIEKEIVGGAIKKDLTSILANELLPSEVSICLGLLVARLFVVTKLPFKVCSPFQ